MEVKSPHQGIVIAYNNKMYEQRYTLTPEEKDTYWASLNWVIDNENDKEVLAWAYNIRGIIYSGRHGFCNE